MVRGQLAASREDRLEPTVKSHSNTSPNLLQHLICRLEYRARHVDAPASQGRLLKTRL